MLVKHSYAYEDVAYAYLNLINGKTTQL